MERTARTTLVIATVVIALTAGPRVDEAPPSRPDAPPSSCKPAPPIDATLTIQPASRGVRLTMTVTAQVDLADAVATIQLPNAAVRDGAPTWRGRLGKGETVQYSILCDAPPNASCTFVGGVVGTLEGGAKVAAPVQVEHNPHLRIPDNGGGVERTNRFGRRIVEYPGITSP